ncbi:MAG: hypothetical protein EO766_02855 [Hydrotalea sp. AMD]|uniref:hypothetical protein n=1 Tax=Hydrotalea sp. AMD TaxID=2501297 RepID=UPI001027E89C|nr:hypothetical protein [Hydrotalea sp. AMD]RWZ90360.1 MAG: hypothetical protein EO766_02855 [Hydrotalea sp. AMD]
MKKETILLLSFVFLNSCMNLKYQISTNSNDKKLIKTSYVLFDFSTQANRDDFFISKLLLALKENNINILDTLTITPLSFITKEEIEAKINHTNSDAIIKVTPLKSIVKNTKYGYGLNSISYLIEVKNSIISPSTRKCIISIKHPDNFGNIQTKLTEAIKTLFQ